MPSSERYTLYRRERMFRQLSSKRYLVLQVSISSFIILCSSTFYATGQPVLTTVVAHCGDDVKLTCSQSGFDVAAGRLWKKGAVTISDTGKDASGTDRYSEKSTSNDFSLVISNAILADVDDYTCEYQFVPSNAASLSFECTPVESGVDVTRNNQNRLFIQIKNIYPSTVNIAVTCALQGNEFVDIKGTNEATTQNGDHFDITWTSDDIISDGTYNCTINVVTRTSTKIVKNELTFSDPSVVDDKTGIIVGLSIGIVAIFVVAVLIIIILIRHLRKKGLIPTLDREQELRNTAETSLAENQKRNNELKAQVEKEKLTAQALKTQAEIDRKKISNLPHKVDQEQQLKNRSEKNLVDSRKANDDLRILIKDLQKQLEKEKVTAQALKTQAEIDTKSISDLQHKLDQELQLRNTTEKNLEESQNTNIEQFIQIKDLQNQVQTEKNRVQALKTQDEALRKDISDLQHKLDQEEQQRNTKEKNLVDSQNTNRELSMKIKDVQNQVQTEKNTFQVLKTQDEVAGKNIPEKQGSMIKTGGGTHVSRMEDIEEEIALLIAPYAGWEDFLDPAPICICIMGELLAISTTTDFPLESIPPRSESKLRDLPGSFGASLVRVVHNGWEAFNTAHTNMDQIRLMSGNVPAELEKATKILIEGSNEELKQWLPIPLKAIKTTADKCNELASTVEEKFVDLISLTGKILEVSTEAIGHYENQQKENEIALPVVVENESMLKKQKEMSEQMYEECKRSVKKAENAYYNAVDHLPSGLAMIGINTVEGISHSFTIALSGASRLLTLGLGKGSGKKSLVEKVVSGTSKSTPAVNATTLDETTIRAYENTNQLKSYTDTLQAESIESGTNLSAPVSAHILYLQRQYLKLQTDLGITRKNTVNDTVIELCKEGIEICKKLMKQDKKEDAKLVDKINHFHQKVLALHVEGTNIMGACPTELKAPKQSMMPPPADANDKTSQQMIQNARFKIEQSSKQFEFMQEKYDRACQRMIENNKKVGEVMAEMKKLNLEKNEFKQIRQTLINGIQALGQLREQWGKLVRFFQMMSNLINCCLKETLGGFLEYASTTKESNMKSLAHYPISSLKKDLIYHQAVEAIKIAHLVNMLSEGYVKISNSHLMHQIAGLGKIIGYDPKTKMHEIIRERNELNKGCTQAQTAIRDLVIEQKSEFDKKVKSRIQKIKTVVGKEFPPTPSSDKSTEIIQAAVKEGMQKVKNAEPELQKGYAYFGRTISGSATASIGVKEREKERALEGANE